MGTKEMTERMIAAIEHPLIDAIGHPTGRKIEKRAPYAIDMDRVIEAAARTGTMIEINSAPDARGRETRVHTRWGVATARRAWLTKADIANTLSWEEFAPLRKRAR